VKVLLAWLGQTDLDAAADEQRVGRGPIAGAVEDRPFDRLVLLNTYGQDEAARYATWLGGRNGGAPALEIIPVDLPNPVDYEAIYKAAVDAVEAVRL